MPNNILKEIENSEKRTKSSPDFRKSTTNTHNKL